MQQPRCTRNRCGGALPDHKAEVSKGQQLHVIRVAEVSFGGLCAARKRHRKWDMPCGPWLSAGWFAKMF
eukprot:5383030-Prorocentrum_lima.AAC.1